MKQLLKEAAWRIGLDVGPRKSNRTQDGFLEKLFDEYKINVVIDVGANVGQFCEKLRRIGFKGKIVSFEPISHSFDELCRRMAGDADWVGFNIALADKPMEAEMTYDPKNSRMASIYPPSSIVPSRFKHWQTVSKKTEKVRVNTLNRVFEDCILDVASPSVFLKCDTQGCDLKVLQGGSDVLAAMRAVQIEVPVFNLYKGAPTLVESIRTLDEFGFAPCAFYPVSTVWDDSVPVIEFDCIAVNKC